MTTVKKPINPSKHWCKNFKANGNGRTPNACERCGRVLSWHENSTGETVGKPSEVS